MPFEIGDFRDRPQCAGPAARSPGCREHVRRPCAGGRGFWLRLAATAAFADFPVVAFRFQRHSTVSAGLIPVFSAVAMAVRSGVRCCSAASASGC
ncbi:hypothetical protein G3I59_47430 [Amycolatopsis rubida]|uniref:Uncharacterized protein n=1 Tax=Amycolatopsis rubida TaxID=112413 RepID=A0ABX0CD87_9PSEU|nr:MULTISPECIES: hypothetical protein [Amycolatopsis]MYW98041.1 hypothetical protein [Amycolatopsis rubida]NEC63026.1 hypothetical protein [Amycolatopsis rubida]